MILHFPRWWLVWQAGFGLGENGHFLEFVFVGFDQEGFFCLPNSSFFQMSYFW